MFAPTETAAIDWLKFLSDELAVRDLRLSVAKTEIVDLRTNEQLDLPSWMWSADDEDPGQMEIAAESYKKLKPPKKKLLAPKPTAPPPATTPPATTPDTPGSGQNHSFLAKRPSRKRIEALRKIGCDELRARVGDEEPASARDIEAWIIGAVFIPDVRHVCLAAEYVASRPHFVPYYLSALELGLGDFPPPQKARVLHTVAGTIDDDQTHAYAKLKTFAFLQGGQLGDEVARAFLMKYGPDRANYVQRLAIECLLGGSSVLLPYVGQEHGWTRRAAVRALNKDGCTIRAVAAGRFANEDPITRYLCV
jgi:hypothetical protein